MVIWSQTRRRFLRLLLWGSGLWLLQGQAAEKPAGLQTVIDVLTGGAQPRPHPGVGLHLPSRAESRLMVPVRVDCQLRDVDMIALLVSGNPKPLAAQFHLEPQMQPYLRTHLRILEDSEVIAIVRANGCYFQQSAKISVTRGVRLMRIEHRSRRRSDGSVEVRLLFLASEEWTSQEDWPERYLDYLSLHLNGTMIMEATLGAGQTPEPFFAVRIDNTTPGDRLEVHWRSNRGASGRIEISLP